MYNLHPDELPAGPGLRSSSVRTRNGQAVSRCSYIVTLCHDILGLPSYCHDISTIAGFLRFQAVSSGLFMLIQETCRLAHLEMIVWLCCCWFGGMFLATSFMENIPINPYISYHAHGDGEVLEQGASNVINAAQKAVDEASRNTQRVRTSFGEQ